jgi:tRNA(fMet)-specific endonuclease VapC
MRLILDSSIVIAAERNRDTVETMISKIVANAGDQDAALSSVGLTELIHGIYRAKTAEIKARREAFIDELLRDFTVYPFTRETALIAGRIDGEQRVQGIAIPYNDLLIGTTALSLGFSLLTTNLRHFRLIPGLTVLPF